VHVSAGWAGRVPHLAPHVEDPLLDVGKQEADSRRAHGDAKGVVEDSHHAARPDPIETGQQASDRECRGQVHDSRR
jgi:hypothetical protein